MFLPPPYNKGFTLAEVLIALVVIGVIAAITVPTMMNKIKVDQTIAQVNSTYSILSQALKMAELHNGKVDTWDIGNNDTPAGSVKLYNYIAPELKKAKSCVNLSGCFANNYKNLKGNNYPWQPNSYNNYARGVLNNGASFLIWSAGTGCHENYSETNSGSLARTCGNIQVDINGAKKPNRAGYDFFSFIITKDGLIPAGTKDYTSRYSAVCDIDSGSAPNGAICTAWLLYKKNMDYTSRHVSWDE